MERSVNFVMRLVGLVIAVLIAAAPAGAQQARAEQVTGSYATAIVPVVGNLFGIGMARWKTDVAILNDTGLPVDVALELPLIVDAPAIFLTLAPGQVQRFSDIVAEAFGIDTAISPLRVTTGSRRSVTIVTNVYAVREENVSPMQPIPVDFGSSFYATRMLDGLDFSDEYRTNIGLVNLGESDADFTIALERIPGRILALTHSRVSAGTMIHESIQSLFPMLTKGAGFSLVIETTSPSTYVYGSVVENATNAGRFVAPRIGARQ
jgi:hypothetical protein